eukprot:3181062-Prorocentrum_lima.AAC.1
MCGEGTGDLSRTSTSASRTAAMDGLSRESGTSERPPGADPPAVRPHVLYLVVEGAVLNEKEYAERFGEDGVIRQRLSVPRFFGTGIQVSGLQKQSTSLRWSLPFPGSKGDVRTPYACRKRPFFHSNPAAMPHDAVGHAKAIVSEAASEILYQTEDAQREIIALPEQSTTPTFRE